MKFKVKPLKIIVYLLIVFGLAALIEATLFFITVVPTGSMKPNVMPGDKLFIQRIHNVDKYRRGDIIIFKYNKSTLYCKRLIGLPNETVDIKNGHIYINGQLYKENYTFNGKYKDDFTIKLKSDEYFVLGDNREHSEDGRYFGAIKDYQLVGKSKFKI